MSSIQCDLVIPDVPDLKPQELTVGRHFYLNCKGSWDKNFDFSKAQIVSDEASQFIFKIFKAEARSVSEFEVDMTLYKAGQLDFPDLVLSDGQLQISLGKQSFQVTSVLPPADPNNPKPPEPFGFAVGGLGWPMAYTWIAAGLFFILLLQVIIAAFRRQRWKQLRGLVQSYDSALAADHQFYKTLRKLEAHQYPLQDLEVAAKTYILRRFQVPVFSLKLKENVLFIKKKYPRLKEARRQVFNILKDLEILSHHPDVTYEQKIKFISQFYQFIEKCEQLAQQGLLLDHQKASKHSGDRRLS